MSTKTIDITPTWSGIVGHMLLVYETTENHETKRAMREEFDRMAAGADQAIDIQKANADAIALVSS